MKLRSSLHFSNSPRKPDARAARCAVLCAAARRAVRALAAPLISPEAQRRRGFARRMGSLTLTLLMLLSAQQPAAAKSDSLVCNQEARRQEQVLAIPQHLLQAIALVESGRWDAEQRTNLAWPWTIYAEGEGRFLPSKQAAVAEVEKLRRRGVRNIDVGCMQVNLLAHPDAFASLDDAFDPATNVAYAGRFLNELYAQDASWPLAGAHYHSQTPEVAAPYRARLVATWQALQRPASEPPLQLASLEADASPHLALGVIFPLASAPETAAPVAGARDPLARTEQQRLAAKQSADAFRLAKIEEYRQKHGLSAGG